MTVVDAIAATGPAPSPRRNLLLKLLGWPALVLQQDPPTLDRWRFVHKHLPPGRGRVLDAGSGSGAFAIYAAVGGKEAVGISMDHEANQVAASRAEMLGVDGVRFVTADLRQLSEMSNQLGAFDHILCLETIEHVMDDARLIADLSAQLRPGGTLLLTTPWLGHKALAGEQLSDTEDGGHVRWGYTAEQLRVLLAAAGICVISEEYLSGLICQSLTSLARRLGDMVGVHAAWALTAPLRVLQIFDGPLTRLLGYPPLAIAIVGVKA